MMPARVSTRGRHHRFLGSFILQKVHLRIFLSIDYNYTEKQISL